MQLSVWETTYIAFYSAKNAKKSSELVTKLIGFFRQQLWLVFGSQRKLVSHLLVGQIEEPADVA